MEGFKCKQCGNCCIRLPDAYCHTVNNKQIEKWKKEGREDILEWVVKTGVKIYDVWVSPTTGEDVNRCPWLRKLPGKEKYICRIQKTKPVICKDYPWSKEIAIKDGCKGFEE